MIERLITIALRFRLAVVGITLLLVIAGTWGPADGSQRPVQHSAVNRPPVTQPDPTLHGP